MITQDDVIYFVLTDRFADGDAQNNLNVDKNDPRAWHGGDFAGLVSKIPYFKALGVTAIWITPVYLSIGRHFDADGYHGYWALDFTKVDPHLYTPRPQLADGSRAYVAQLVEAFHDAGLKIILDMVVNHTGYHNPTYQAYPDKPFGPQHFNAHDPSSEVDAQLSGLPDLDHDQPYVVDYFIENILDWIEHTGIDAIRMDTVKHVEDAFWYHFKATVRTRHPGVTLIGEVLSFDPDKLGRYQQEHDFDTVFDFPLSGQLRGCLIWDRPMTELARPRLDPREPRGVLDRDKRYTNANRLITLLDNHDLNERVMTEALRRTSGDRQEASRLVALCLTVLFTTRGIPKLYYGTEIGLEGAADPDNRRDMPWDLIGPDHRPLPSHPHARQMFDHITALVQLRADHPALRYGYLLTLWSDAGVYAYLRAFRDDAVLIVVHNTHHAMAAPLTIDIAANTNVPPRVIEHLEGRTLHSHTPDVPPVTITQGRASVRLPRKTAGLWSV